MNILEAIRLALKTIWSQKMKSAFSVVGVFVGVMFLIAVVSVIQGMNAYMTDQVAGSLLGVNQFTLRRYPNVQTGQVGIDEFRRWQRRPQITYDDAEAVAEGIQARVLASWESTRSANVDSEMETAEGVRIIGAQVSYLDIKGWQLAQGRNFSRAEEQAGRPVVVLGFDVAEALFGDRDPLAQTVKIRGFPYRVIGVAEKQGTIFGQSLDNFVVAPALSPVKRFISPPGTIRGLLVKSPDQISMQQAMGEAESIMRIRRRLRPAEEASFVLETSDSILEFWNRINTILIAAVPGLVSISLVVGGIVIMNIMLMAVAERTREIGIRKSLGARYRDILRQFLIESASLALVGAGLGIGTGIALAALVEAVTPLPAEVAPWSIGVAVLLGAGVGIAAGAYPARRAALLDPVAAMRQE